eukprot:TRINITY_DN95909_c0_g1_i1.p1 TRINITY_DN95909_c0_g1~~TRINITY_DN95909_c0_g1_i1.p1  ORF type:complete len:274 (+),score=2.15 TRINITY_DN95909_c0_g1_i1:46-867(+)
MDMTDTWGRTGVHRAAKAGNIELLQTYLKNGADISVADNCGDTALLWAAMEGHIDMLDWLLLNTKSSLTERDLSGMTAPLWAARQGHTAMLHWLQTKLGDKVFADHDNAGNSVLSWSVQCNYMDQVKWLCKEHNFAQEEKNLALAHASKSSLFPMMEFLLGHGGAKVESLSWSGFSDETNESQVSEEVLVWLVKQSWISVFDLKTVQIKHLRFEPLLGMWDHGAHMAFPLPFRVVVSLLMWWSTFSPQKINADLVGIVTSFLPSDAFTKTPAG